MAGSPKGHRSKRLASAFLALGVIAAAGVAAKADLRIYQKPRRETPMRFARIVSADPACQPNCPEWIAAEGEIEPGTAAAFADILKRLGGRRLPILIHSPGGSVVDAIEIGQRIRAERLVVAVARTLAASCPETGSRCADGPGEAITGGAKCASACTLILAGGVERMVGPNPLVGVHQITTLVKETEGSEHLTTTHKIYEQDGADAAVASYLTAMDVGEPAIKWMRATPAASIHWLSAADLRASGLATLALDAAHPILTSGANGLNGYAFDGDPPRPDLFVAHAVQAAGRAARRREHRGGLRLPARGRGDRGDRHGDRPRRRGACRFKRRGRSAARQFQPRAHIRKRRAAAHRRERRVRAGAHPAGALLRPCPRRRARRRAGQHGRVERRTAAFARVQSHRDRRRADIDRGSLSVRRWRAAARSRSR